MFKRVLVANRGEIALRIIRACKELGIETVAVYSEPDEQSLAVQVADEAICIGPAPSSESYLKVAHIISAAEIADVDAIHPGYGFLAESAHFAQICQDCKITFIGPEPDQITRMGDKAIARETMRKAGVPVTPGSDGLITDLGEAKSLARKLGYPVLVKAAAGGGGKGMRLAPEEASLEQAFLTAGAEAERAFGNAGLYLEKYVENARHIEVQILADRHGNVVHLGERDCSIQRRHQKLLEESPSPAVSPDVRKKLGRAATKAAQAVKYSSAGTVEFLFDEQTQKFYFMEMNTRIQVEHPVTEEVTGVDLIKAMIRSAAGEKLSVTQRDIRPEGHAIEFRVNAEDPFHDFRPSPGMVEWVSFPGGIGIRIDSHVYTGYEISPHYDSMIAKVIATGKDRPEAISRMSRALGEFLIDGPATTIPLGLALMRDASFRKGDYTTAYLGQALDEGILEPPTAEPA